MFEYSTTVERVVDGDTVDICIDLGFKISYRHSCRLHGINAPEKVTAEGKAAKAFLESLLPAGAKLTVQTKKDKLEKFGRVLGVLILQDGRSVADVLVQEGHAVAWDGRGARPT